MNFLNRMLALLTSLTQPTSSCFISARNLLTSITKSRFSSEASFSRCFRKHSTPFLRAMCRSSSLMSVDEDVRLWAYTQREVIVKIQSVPVACLTPTHEEAGQTQVLWHVRITSKPDFNTLPAANAIRGATTTHNSTACTQKHHFTWKFT